MIIKPFIVFLATSLLATKLVQGLSRKRHLRRVRDDQRRHHDEVTRWEGEGGNLPIKPQR
ncbi:hypothetical protein [Roseateles sp.]|uniref:hypothetical protein n=1 Tax=Roseateles sp. TaxID=1971397 RepID=UPI003264204C